MNQSNPSSDKKASGKIVSKGNPASDRLVPDKLASDNVSNKKLATGKVSGDNLSSDNVSNDKVFRDRLASDKLEPPTADEMNPVIYSQDTQSCTIT